jgi:hypothetical protein
VDGGNTIGQNESQTPSEWSTKTINDSGSALQITENLSPAYHGSGGRVTNWQRELGFDRAAHRLTVHDTCTIGSGVTAYWQLQTVTQPTLQGDGSYLAGNLRIRVTAPASPAVTFTSITQGWRMNVANAPGTCEFNVTLQATN